MPPSHYVADRRLCRTGDGRVVPETDPDAHWLYAIPGHRIPWDEAVRHGLVDQDADSGDDAAGDGEEPPPEPKAKPRKTTRKRTSRS